MPIAQTTAASHALADWLLRRLAEQPGRPLGLALAQGLRAAIQQGLFAPGQQLPASRALARQLAVARNTVVAVYAQLQAEGFVVAGQGAGTFVRQRVQEQVADLVRLSRRGTARTASLSAPFTSAPPLSLRAQRYRDDPLHRFWVEQPFCPGQFDAALFPHAQWNRLLTQLLRRPDPAQLRHGPAGGDPGLRAAIAQHVHAARGVRCEPAQVVITDGTSQSLSLVARLLCEPGDRVAMEDPGYWGASRALSDLGLVLSPTPVDAAGACVPPAPAAGQRAARLAYLTPSNQFPTGAAMPLARRLAWLAHARSQGTLLLEDDYDSELRLQGMPFPSLQGLDVDTGAGNCVIYLGSFSKTMFPGIRLGYLVVPPALAEVFARVGADHDRDGDQLLQMAMARFIGEGHYAAHVRRLRHDYRARREALVAALQTALPALALPAATLQLLGGWQGAHLCLALPPGSDDRAIAAACAARGVSVIPLSVYALQAQVSGLVLSYAAVPAPAIAALVARIAPVLQTLIAPR